MKGYQHIRDDFEDYISGTVPHIAKYPPSTTFIKNVVPKLKAFGLTKTEVLLMVNLGVGLPRGQQPVNEDQTINDGAGNGEDEKATRNEELPNAIDEGQDEPYQPSDMELLSCVIEELDDRYSGEEGREQIQKILETVREEYAQAHSVHASTNGAASGDANAMDVS